jgi:TatD DNase family protein
MLVETDSPFLTPVPYRGKRNEPGYTKYVVDEIAKIKQIDPNIVAEVTTMNANKLFRLEPST